VNKAHPTTDSSVNRGVGAVLLAGGGRYDYVLAVWDSFSFAMGLSITWIKLMRQIPEYFF
jgi:hypothetical protein